MDSPYKLSINLQAHEVEILQLWLKHASDTTWTDPQTQKAMQRFAKRFDIELKVIAPQIYNAQYGELGDF